MKDWGKEAIQAAGLGLIDQHSTLTPGELRGTREELNLSQAELGLIMRVSQSLVVQWERGFCPVPLGALGMLRMIKTGLIEIPEKCQPPLTFRRVKNETMAKLKSYGHASNYWKKNGEVWVYTCDNPHSDPDLSALGHDLPFPCDFVVRITADKEVTTNRPWGECLGEKK